jgi:hypothetical protein
LKRTSIASLGSRTADSTRSDRWSGARVSKGLVAAASALVFGSYRQVEPAGRASAVSTAKNKVDERPGARPVSDVVVVHG